MDDDAPPIQSLDDMDELPAAASGSTSLVPSKFTSHSTSPNEQASALPVTTPPADAPKLIIFGFSRSALPQVIDHLSLIGPIVSVETPSNTNANYATITFQESWQAARAIRRNGELVQNGTIMIGIKWADPSRADVSQFSSAANNNGPMGSSATPVGQFGQARPSNPKSPFNPLPNSSAITTPSTPQQPNAAPAVGSPVPILGSNYKATDLQHSGSRWSISGMLGNSAAPQTHGDAANANTAANNPFVPQQQQQQSQQAPGVWSKVSDAIFGF